jgi:hypothetical protein
MLRKDYDRKGSVAKKKKRTGREPLGARSQDEIISANPTIVK